MISNMSDFKSANLSLFSLSWIASYGESGMFFSMSVDTGRSLTVGD